MDRTKSVFELLREIDMMKVACLLVVTTLALLGCNSEVSEGQLLGAYRAMHTYADEELELSAAHMYVQRVTLQGQRTSTTHSGTWQFDSSKQQLTLLDALLIDDNFGKLNPEYKVPAKGRAVLIVGQSSAIVTLSWSDEVRVRFKKINP